MVIAANVNMVVTSIGSTMLYISLDMENSLTTFEIAAVVIPVAVVVEGAVALTVAF